MKRLFLLTATGQNIANLIPVLQLYQPGDQLLWLESETARKNDWSQGAKQALQKKGIDAGESLACGEQPAEFKQKLSQWLNNHPFNRILWVGNGGTKPQSLAIQSVLHQYNTDYLYSQSYPSCLQRFPLEQPEKMECLNYDTDLLDLQTVLTCSGYQIVAGKEQKIWPDPPKTLHKDFRDGELLAQYRNMVLNYLENNQIEEIKLPRYQAIHFCLKDWQNGLVGRPIKPYHWKEISSYLINILSAASQTPLPSYQEIQGQLLNWQKMVYFTLQKGKPSFSQWEGMVNSFINIIEKYYNHKIKEKKSKSSKISGGDFFEQLVATRFIQWLEQKAPSAVRHIISEVWINVKVKHSRQEQQNSQEFDLVIVLNNGILINLECKAGQYNKKDLDARLLNTHLSASQLATMAVIIPVYSDLQQDEILSKDMIDRWLKLTEIKRIKAIPLTLKNHQPEWRRIDGQREIILVPAFETALKKLFKPYI